MASSYAVPPPRSNYHTPSNSFSSIQSSPGKATANGFVTSNGGVSRSPLPNGLLFTHAEMSRETSPIPFPDNDHIHSKYVGSIEQNVSAFRQNSSVSGHKHTQSESSMRSRPRGESDLGRPAEAKSSVYQPTLESIPAASASWFSLPEALTSMLVTGPYIFASMAYSSMSGVSGTVFPPLAKYAPIPLSDLSEAETLDPAISKSHGFIDASILTSGTLLVVAIFAKMQSSARIFDKDKEVTQPAVDIRSLMTGSHFRSMILRTLSLWLPFYASMLLGGSRTGLILLVAISANLTCSDRAKGPLLEQWKHLWASKVATSVVMLLSFMADEVGLTVQTPIHDLMLGYLALATSILVLPPPLPSLAITSPSRPNSNSDSPAPASNPSLRRGSAIASLATSSLISSAANVDMTLISGVILSLLAVVTSTLLSYSPSISNSSLILITFTIASTASLVLFSQPTTLRSQSKAGLALGCFITASSSFLFSPSLWPGTVCNGGLSALSFLGILYDTHKISSGHDNHDHVHAPHTHQHHHHHHHHQHEDSGPSGFSQLLLARCEPGSLVFGILNEKDSRRIAYFTILNFGFMLVQGVYGYLSGSLGLLSDTVHMFFDCLGLVVGLGAAMASKWPTSPERPYGWSKLNTLSGFGNGIFLMLVSIEFTWEAIEGILERRQLRHVQELLVVSVLGLLVNMVGLMFFHSHAGHDHSGHSHSDGNLEPHSGNSAQDHSHNHAHHHHHDHSNDNMHGIFLHIAADAGGSLAVIFSTALNIWRPSFVWDPLATILIAILIFAAAVPLVISSGQKLLLVVPNELEYTIKNTLQDLGDLRGVVGYSVPRFWVDDKDSASTESHGHTHGECDHAPQKKIMGVVHIIAEASSDLDDIRERVEAFIADRNMNIVIQVEREGDGQCWCGSIESRSD